MLKENYCVHVTLQYCTTFIQYYRTSLTCMSKTICFNALMEYYCLQLVFGYPIPGYWHGLFYLKVYGKKYCDGSAVIYSQAALKGDSASHNRVALIYCCCTECESHEKYVHVCPYANAQAIVTLSYIIQMERC